MKQSTQTSLIVLGVLVLVIYFLMNSSFYRLTQLDHLDDRIRFGRLEFHKVANVSLGKMEIHNREKIFTINFAGEPVFVGEMEHFLVLTKSKGNIESNQDSFYEIQDEMETLCKIQRVLSLYPNQETMSIDLYGNFKDCKDSDYKITFKQTADNKLQIEVEASQKYNRAYLLFHDEPTNHYYGLGEQFSHLNLGRNRPFSTFVRQKGIGRGQQPLTLLSNLIHKAGGSYFTSYAPAPIWFSSKKIAYILNDYHYMAWINNKMLVWSNKFTVTYIKGQSYKQLVKEVSKINGYTKPVPDWVNSGAILGVQDGTDEVLRKYQVLEKQGAKISGLWIQDWVGKRQSLGYSRLWWNWQLDQKHYPNWSGLRQKLSNDGVQILAYINPMLTDANNKQNVKNNFYSIAEQKGYFVKVNEKAIYKTKAVSDFDAGLIDFKNEQAVQFFNSLFTDIIQQTGIKGMMVDFGQAFPLTDLVDTIQNGTVVHNEYPLLYQKAVQSVINSLAEPQSFYTFVRAGYLNSPKVINSLWTGDHLMNFNEHTGLPSCLTAILSSGLVGYSNTHCDIGGYTHIKSSPIKFTERTQPLLIRWMQLSAFTSVFRTHQGNTPDQTLQVYSNKFLAKVFGFYSNLYAALSEYRTFSAQESQKQGLPLVRALFLQLNGLEGTEEIKSQFFLGNDILVSPFLSEDSQRKYFLPKGQWKAVWDGKIFKGCDCERIWKDILPPVFIRSNSTFTSKILEKVGQLVKKYEDAIYRLSSNSQQDL